MKNNQAIIVVIVFLFFQFAYSNNTKDVLYLKDGSNIVTQVASVDSFAFYLQDDRLVSIKLVDSISTQNEILISELSTFYSTAFVTNQENSSTVSFVNILIPAHTYKERKFWQGFSSILNYTNEGNKNCEVQFNLIPQWSSNIILQITLSSAISFKKVREVSQVSFGFGWKYDFHLAEILLLLNYGEKRVTNNYNPFVSKQTMFGSVYFQKRIDNSNIVFSIGSHLYFINNPAQENAAKNSFIGGVGYIF